MNDIDQRQQEIITAFETLSDREDMLNYIMELGARMPPMDEVLRTEHNTVRGCMSQVWLVCKRRNDRLFFEVDSNTAITKGLLALLLRVLSGQTAATIAQAHLYFVQEIGMTQLIGSQRSNGFASIVKHIQRIARTQENNSATP